MYNYVAFFLHLTQVTQNIHMLETSLDACFLHSLEQSNKSRPAVDAVSPKTSRTSSIETAGDDSNSGGLGRTKLTNIAEHEEGVPTKGVEKMVVTQEPKTLHKADCMSYMQVRFVCVFEVSSSCNTLS